MEPVGDAIACGALACYSGIGGEEDLCKSVWMNKAEIAERLTARTGMNEAAPRQAIDDMHDVIGKPLTNGLNLPNLGFGRYGTKNRPARKGCHRRISEAIEIKPSRSWALKPMQCSRILPTAVACYSLCVTLIQQRSLA